MVIEIYVASVRTHMVKLVAQLDATGLSRLAWLFLLDGDEENGRLYAEKGLAKDRANDHCARILERLDQSRTGWPIMPFTRLNG
jgi:hypothetical protein